MRRSVFVSLLAIAIGVGLTNCQPKERKLYVASINDMHANLDKFPVLANIIDSLRSEHPDLVLFSAGDIRSGNPINDCYEEPARPMYDLMNAVGFDLTTFGNHEWDGGVDALRKVMETAKFPFVCANVTFDDTLRMPSAPYKVLEWKGLKIGVIGAIHVALNGIPEFHPKHAVGSHFRPIEEVLPEYLFLRKECDALFLLSHCGYEEDREIAESFPQLDAIFGGHSHTLVEDNNIVNGVLITQAMNRMKYITLSTFVFDRKGKIIAKESHNIPIPEDHQQNPDVKAMVDEFNRNDFFSQVVGYNDASLEDCRECFGYLMTDAQMAATEAQMAFQNWGGVRIDSLSERPILVKDVFSLDPFNNELICFNLTGQEIVDFLKTSFFADHGPNFCAGCAYTFSVDDEGQMKDCKVTLADGKPLDLKATYKVTMNSYMSSAFKFDHEDAGEDSFITSNDAIMDYLKAHPHINYAGVSRVQETD